MDNLDFIIYVFEIPLVTARISQIKKRIFVYEFVGKKIFYSFIKMDSSRERDSTTPEVTSDMDILKDQLQTYQRLNIDLSKKVQEYKILLNVTDKELLTARNELLLEKQTTAELKHTLMVSTGHFSHFAANFVSTLEKCQAKVYLDITMPGSNIAPQQFSQLIPHKPSVDPGFEKQLETICEEDSMNMTDEPRVSSTPFSAPNRQARSLNLLKDREITIEEMTESSPQLSAVYEDRSLTEQAARDVQDEESMNFAGGAKTSSTPLPATLRNRTSSNTKDSESTDDEEISVGGKVGSTSMPSALRDQTNISTEIPKITLTTVVNRDSEEVDPSDPSDATDEPLKKKTKGKPAVTRKLVVKVNDYLPTDSQMESYIDKFHGTLEEDQQEELAETEESEINEQNENMPSQSGHKESSTSSIDSVSKSRKRKAKVTVPNRTDERPKRSTRGKVIIEPKLNTKLRR